MFWEAEAEKHCFFQFACIFFMDKSLLFNRTDKGVFGRRRRSLLVAAHRFGNGRWLIDLRSRIGIHESMIDEGRGTVDRIRGLFKKTIAYCWRI